MRHAKGFTLVELLVVLILLAIIAALVVPGMIQGRRADNERNADSHIHELARANADFRANDRDGNGILDYWTRDVSGLYTVHPPGTSATSSIKLIQLSLAAADAENLPAIPVGLKNPGTTSITFYTSSKPNSGYWYFSMVCDESSASPDPYRQITDGSPYATHNRSSFAFGAFPDSPSSGRQLFIINEGNSAFKRGCISGCRGFPSNPPGLPLPSSIFGGNTSSPWNWPSDLNIQSYYGRYY